MHTQNLFPISAFKSPVRKSESIEVDSVSEIDTEEKEKEHSSNEFLVCRQCRLVITLPSESIVIQGGHEHTYANPSGILFQIGCFKNAQGCRYVGAPSDDFSWFGGYLWRVAVCNRCMSHLGWMFIGVDRDSFHGLILDRLVLSTPESDES